MKSDLMQHLIERWKGNPDSVHIIFRDKHGQLVLTVGKDQYPISKFLLHARAADDSSRFYTEETFDAFLLLGLDGLGHTITNVSLSERTPTGSNLIIDSDCRQCFLKMFLFLGSGAEQGNTVGMNLLFDQFGPDACDKAFAFVDDLNVVSLWNYEYTFLLQRLEGGSVVHSKWKGADDDVEKMFSPQFSRLGF